MSSLLTPVGGALTSVVAALVGYVVIATTRLADHAWSWWALLGALAGGAGILLEIRSGERSPLIGVGMAVGALIAFGGCFVLWSALGWGFGL